MSIAIIIAIIYYYVNVIFIPQPFPLVSNLIPDPEAKYQLFDRIVNVRQGFTVPFALRGTVVGIHPGEKEYETIYDVVFDEKFPNGIDLGYVFFLCGF